MLHSIKLSILSLVVLFSVSQVCAQAVNDSTVGSSTTSANSTPNASSKQSPSEITPKGVDPVGGPLPKKVVDQLGLTPEQKNQLDGALSARKDLQAANRLTRDTAYKSLTDQLASDEFDPRVVIQQRQQARLAMDARSDAVQQKWLVFWDGLSQTQRNTLVQYMREQHAAHAKSRAK
jgi:uncharacterized membrane protein